MLYEDDVFFSLPDMFPHIALVFICLACQALPILGSPFLCLEPILYTSFYLQENNIYVYLFYSLTSYSLL